MAHLWLDVVAAALAGALMTIQGTFNSALLKRIGVANMAVLVSLIGFLAAVVVFFIWGRWSKLTHVVGAPWYAWLGGILGVVIIVGVAFAIGHLSAALAISSIITAQLATALIVDHFGLFGSEKVGLSWLRAIGFVLMVIGTRLMVDR